MKTFFGLVVACLAAAGMFMLVGPIAGVLTGVVLGYAVK